MKKVILIIVLFIGIPFLIASTTSTPVHYPASKTAKDGYTPIGTPTLDNSWIAGLSYNSVTSVLSVDGTLTFADKYHYHTIMAGTEAQGNTAPTEVTIGTYRFEVFDADAETVILEFEIPDEWTADSDMVLEVYFTGEVGTPMADTETFISQIEYRCRAIGDVIDGGTAVTTDSTYTQSGNATNKQLYEHSITLDYDDADQPLVAGEVLGIKYNRDMTSDSYGSGINILLWEIKYEADAPPSHF